MHPKQESCIEIPQLISVSLIEDESHMGIRDRLYDALLERMNQTRDSFKGYCWERQYWRKDARQATWDYTLMTRQRHTEEGETA
jgi:uncharacterized sulfatase